MFRHSRGTGTARCLTSWQTYCRHAAIAALPFVCLRPGALECRSCVVGPSSSRRETTSASPQQTLFLSAPTADWFYARELIRAAENGEPICPPGLSVLDAIGDLPSISAGGGQEAMPYGAEPFSDYQRARRGAAVILFNHRSRAHSPSMLDKMKMITEGGRNQELADEQRLRSSEGEYFSQAYARLHRHGIAQTITTYFHNPGSGRFTHYHDLRALTAREAARFQNFDDNFILTGKLEQQMRHVGNAVPVLMAKAIADHCAQLLGRGAEEDELAAAHI